MSRSETINHECLKVDIVLNLFEVDAFCFQFHCDIIFASTSELLHNHIIQILLLSLKFLQVMI
jgi:hypothetical protein